MPWGARGKGSRDPIQVLSQPEVRERIVADGSEPIGSTPEDFRQFMLADLAKWAKLVKQSGAKLD